MTQEAMTALLTLFNPTEWNEQTAADVNARLETASAAHIADWAVATFGRPAHRRRVDAGHDPSAPLRHAARRASTCCSSRPATTSPRPSPRATRPRDACRSPWSTRTPRQTVAEQDAEFGKDLFDRDPNLCCAMRKVEPLGHALDGYDAWVTGTRRVDAATRAELPVVQWDAKHGLVKINPLGAVVRRAGRGLPGEQRPPPQPARRAGLPEHRLRALHAGPSRRARTPAPVAGRAQDKTECGIHE